MISSSKPYLVEALYCWIIDNDWTPYIVLDISLPNVDIPMEYAQEGKITLDVSNTAARDLVLGHEYKYISFKARFSGIECEIYSPIGALVGIYAMENGRGMEFEAEEEDEANSPPPKIQPTKLKKTKHHLKRKKKDHHLHLVE